MNRIISIVLGLMLTMLFVGSPASATKPDENGEHKIVICHKGKQTIEVDKAALDAHLKHGDTEGACKPVEPEPPVDPGPQPPPKVDTPVLEKSIVNCEKGTAVDKYIQTTTVYVLSEDGTKWVLGEATTIETHGEPRPATLEECPKVIVEPPPVTAEPPVVVKPPIKKTPKPPIKVDKPKADKPKVDKPVKSKPVNNVTPASKTYAEDRVLPNAGGPGAGWVVFGLVLGTIGAAAVIVATRKRP